MAEGIHAALTKLVVQSPPAYREIAAVVRGYPREALSLPPLLAEVVVVDSDWAVSRLAEQFSVDLAAISVRKAALRCLDALVLMPSTSVPMWPPGRAGTPARIGPED